MLNRTENTTYGLDLSKDWTNSTLSFVQTSRPSDAPGLLESSLWYDGGRDSIYCYGGIRSYATSALNGLASPVVSVWGFKHKDDGSATWSQIIGPVSTTPWPHKIPRLAYGSSISDGKRAYYLGGWFSWESTPTVGPVGTRFSPPGLLTLDFDTFTITNSSDGGYRVAQPGIMITIPMYGDDGILVVLPGGSDVEDYAFNNITLYDKKNQKWYSQLASGDIPEPRICFCAVGVEGDQNGSFEIFIHGGVVNNLLGSQATNSDQVYILSLPSFRWFRANYTSTQSRGGHTCHATNSSQIIMIGGQDPFYSRNYLSDGVDLTPQPPADPWSQGIGIFDMTTLSFKDSYQAKAKAYVTPDVIKKYYSIDGNQYPSWTTVAVKELFEPSLKKSSNTTNPISSNSTLSNPSSSTISNSRSHLSHGAVAGIVIGCFTAVALCVAAFFMLKRRSTNNKSTPFDRSPQMLHNENRSTELSAEQGKPEMMTETQDRAQLPNTGRKFQAELSSDIPSAELYG